MVLVGWIVFGKTHIVVDAKDGIFGRQIAQGLDSIEAEDQARDKVLKELLGSVIIRAVGFKPFVVVVLANGS